MARKRKHASRFHRFVYQFLKIVVRPIIYLKTAFSIKAASLKSSPSLIYVNHNCDLDPVFVSFGIRGHIYFLSSAHVLHKWYGFLVKWLFEPIIRYKGRTEIDGTLDVLRRLRAGDNVCIFIEGERSYDGKTAKIADSAAHLAKISGFPLVNYRITGGYLTHPRWASSLRRGYLRGDIAGEYSAEELCLFSKDELQDIIRRDLYVDAYADQQLNPQRYLGKNLAERLETALFICPLCQSGSLHSEADSFRCDCGLELVYNEYGFFESPSSGELPFAHVGEWFSWQKQKIEELCREAENTKATDIPLLGDQDQSFYVYEGKKKVLYGTGALNLYLNHLEIDFVGRDIWRIPLTEVKSFNCLQQMIIILTLADGTFFEIISPYPRSAVKYQLYFSSLKSNLIKD